MRIYEMDWITLQSMYELVIMAYISTPNPAISCI